MTSAYLLTAGEGLVPTGAIDATRHYYENKVLARGAWERHDTVVGACREKLANLMLGATAGDIALLGSTSEGVNAIYSLIDWQAGDNVVLPVNALEFLDRPAGRQARAAGHRSPDGRARRLGHRARSDRRRRR